MTWHQLEHRPTSRRAPAGIVVIFAYPVPGPARRFTLPVAKPKAAWAAMGASKVAAKTTDRNAKRAFILILPEGSPPRSNNAALAK
jgi:hypothetical protein